MLIHLRTFLRDESGAYGDRIRSDRRRYFRAIIAVVKGLGTKLNSTFSSVSTQLR